MIELIDMHCHILPGLDDGSKGMEQSLNMIRIAYKDGIRKIICTPHYHIGRSIAEYEKREEAIEELRSELDTLGISMELYLGAEIYYFTEAIEHLNNGSIHTMAGGRCILLEFDPSVEYRRIKNAVNEAVMNGYVPIVAHVERYMCMVSGCERCEELRSIGALIQVNAMSLMGDYGRDAKRYIKKLMKNRLVSFVASDAHSDGHRRPALAECYAYVSKRFGEDYADDIFNHNQMKVLDNKY